MGQNSSPATGSLKFPDVYGLYLKEDGMIQSGETWPCLNFFKMHLCQCKKSRDEIVILITMEGVDFPSELWSYVVRGNMAAGIGSTGWVTS